MGGGSRRINRLSLRSSWEEKGGESQKCFLSSSSSSPVISGEESEGSIEGRAMGTTREER